MTFAPRLFVLVWLALISISAIAPASASEHESKPSIEINMDAIPGAAKPIPSATTPGAAQTPPTVRSPSIVTVPVAPAVPAIPKLVPSLPVVTPMPNVKAPVAARSPFAGKPPAGLKVPVQPTRPVVAKTLSDIKTRPVKGWAGIAPIPETKPAIPGAIIAAAKVGPSSAAPAAAPPAAAPLPATATPPPAPLVEPRPTSVVRAEPQAVPAANAPAANAPAAPAGTGLSIAFQSGAVDLDDAARLKLDELSALLLRNERRMQLRAFAASPRPNALSEARRLALHRALAVRGYLIEKGLPGSRVDVRAIGEPEDGSPPDRVEIIYYGS